MRKYFTRHTLYGSLATIFLSTLVLYLLFGELLRSPNSVFFAGSGDGLQSYYGTLYHVLHDSTYARSYGMNHPYGEMVLYTGNQPVIANAIKFISENIVDISGYTIGMLNLFMLFSIVIGALFIFLIFHYLKLPVPVSVVLGVAIAFLSPQIGRLGGHFSLSYVFFIPLMIYLFIQFYKGRSYWISFFIFLTALVAGFTHAYFLGFFGLLFLFFWPAVVIRGDKDFRNLNVLLPHMLLQFVIPIVILIIYSLLNDSVSDRTSRPWGILYLRAYPESIFLPVGKPYGKFLERIMTFNHIDWEGYAYTGLVASVGFLIVIIQMIRKTASREFRSILNITDNRLLNIFFWASFAGLLYSFGLPFILGLEGLIDYIGPLKQLRGIARFSWLFFYVMNFVTFYLLWNWLKEKRRRVVYWSLLLLPLLFILYDAWLNARSMEYYMKNRIPMLEDWENELPENQWINKIDPADYQAIIPIPYFHVGSENIWIEPKGDILKNTFVASLKTGLPTTGVLLSRTSIGQSYRNIEMMLEPYRIPEILSDLPNSKPFLLLVENISDINNVEREMISGSELLTGNNRFRLYSLSIDSVKRFATRKKTKVIEEFQSQELVIKGDFLVTDSSVSFYYNGFEKGVSKHSYFGEFGFEGSLGDFNTIFNNILPDPDLDSMLVVSFWLGNARKDLMPRSTIEFDLLDQHGDRISTEYWNLGNLYTLLDGEWALLEHTIKLHGPGNNLKITIWNHNLKKEELIIDELLIYPESQVLFKKLENGIIKNNRQYF